jgi:uncharacterized protein
MATPTDTGFVQMRLAKVVALALSPDKDPAYCIVLEETSQDRQMPIQIGQMEAFTLAASLTGLQFGRPMGPQFAAGLLRALGAQVRQVRIDQVIGASGQAAFGATVEIEGTSGLVTVDARPSDALNLLALMPAPIFVAPEVLTEAQTRMAGDSQEARFLRHAVECEQMTVRQGPPARLDILR